MQGPETLAGAALLAESLNKTDRKSWIRLRQRNKVNKKHNFLFLLSCVFSSLYKRLEATGDQRRTELIFRFTSHMIRNAVQVIKSELFNEIIKG